MRVFKFIDLSRKTADWAKRLEKVVGPAASAEGPELEELQERGGKLRRELEFLVFGVYEEIDTLLKLGQEEEAGSNPVRSASTFRNLVADLREPDATENTFGYAEPVAPVDLPNVDLPEGPTEDLSSFEDEAENNNLLEEENSDPEGDNDES